MKRAYEKATVKVTLFDNSDVVTTSGIENGEDIDDCFNSTHWKNPNNPNNHNHGNKECGNNNGKDNGNKGKWQ